MKKRIVLIVLILIVAKLNSQNLINEKLVLKWNEGNINWTTSDTYSHILTSGQTGSAYPFQTRGNLVFQPRANAGTDIVFGTGAIPEVRAVIKANGNIGIGTTNPLYSLDVIGDIRINEASYLRFGSNQWAVQQTGGNLNFLEVGKSDGVLYMKSGGNVGVGTTNPLSRLHIFGSGTGSKGLTIQNNVEQIGNSATLWFKSASSNSDYRKGALMFVNDGRAHGRGDFILALNNSPNSSVVKASDAKMVVKSGTGNVGIGTTNPNAKFEIVDNTSNIGNYSDGSLQIAGSNNVIGFVGQSNLNPGFNRWGIKLRENKDGDFSIHSYSTNSTRFIINSSGDIGIGTINPDAKLAVNGKIHTKEVKVDLIGWSDFVFENDYNLPSLKEVEKHIKEKGHLKDIPSAKEVKKNGIFLGEMDAKLLQKIEELTLYTIEQEKKIKVLERQSIKLETQNTKLEKQQKEIDELKTLLKQLLKK
ncbi:tail fiber protein [uncultured Tenacibaculum sp.]|uniref:tail fiber protein n=1 Tax=uncultured Tenacibaculum sp. TaxID=174713 RepID=UPI002638A0BC|nr:tail fiber protein [uncultured Tenacibaculum sp.]